MEDFFSSQAKILDIEAGKPIVILNEKEALRKSIFLNDRIEVSSGDKRTIAMVDLSKKVPEGKMVLFEEAADELCVDEGAEVNFELSVKPDSINYIKKKVKGGKLGEEEVRSIISDSVNFRLSDSELMAYTIALEMSDFSLEEAKYLTRAMVDTGDRIDIENALDKHCVGGVPGNRTTPLIVSIIAAAGHKIPKTSSRAISSPAGTADAVEVLTGVEHSASEIKDIVRKTNGCIVWGGGVNLAPADDEFIRVRQSLTLDPLEQVLSSVLAKKKSVGSDTVLIDIPIGEEAKIQSKEEANKLSKYFKKLGKEMDMSVVTLISEGSQPIGNGIGPALEIRDVLKILETNGRKGPQDLKEKSVRMAEILLKEAGSRKSAEDILSSGSAYEKFVEIMDMQGGDVPPYKDLEMASNSRTIESEKRGRVSKIHNAAIDEIARMAGCPKQKKSGMYLHKKVGDPVEEGDELLTLYSQSEKRLHRAVEKAEDRTVFEFKSLLGK